MFSSLLDPIRWVHSIGSARSKWRCCVSFGNIWNRIERPVNQRPLNRHGSCFKRAWIRVRAFNRIEPFNHGPMGISFLCLFVGSFSSNGCDWITAGHRLSTIVSFTRVSVIDWQTHQWRRPESVRIRLDSIDCWNQTNYRDGHFIWFWYFSRSIKSYE